MVKPAARTLRGVSRRIPLRVAATIRAAGRPGRPASRGGTAPGRRQRLILRKGTMFKKALLGAALSASLVAPVAARAGEVANRIANEQTASTKESAAGNDLRQGRASREPPRGD